MAASEAKVAHLGFIQRAVHAYDAHGTVTKVAALLVTAGLFYVFLMMADVREGVLQLAAMGGGVILFVLWLTDAYYYQQKLAYSKLYDNARQSEETDFDMNAEKHKEPHAVQMWRAPVSWLYVAQIGAVAFLSFMA